MAYSELFLDNQTATTSSFTLEEGKYWVDGSDAHGSGGPEWTLQKLGSDGTSWIDMSEAGINVVLNSAGVAGKGYLANSVIPKGDYRYKLNAGTPAGTYFNIVRLKTAA